MSRETEKGTDTKGLLDFLKHYHFEVTRAVWSEEDTKVVVTFRKPKTVVHKTDTRKPRSALKKAESRKPDFIQRFRESQDEYKKILENI